MDHPANRENKDVRIQVTDLISLIGGDQIIFPDSDILANSNAEVVFPGGAGKKSKGAIFFPDEGPGNSDFVAEADKGRVDNWGLGPKEDLLSNVAWTL